MQLSSWDKKRNLCTEYSETNLRFNLVPRVSEYVSSVCFWIYQAKEKILIMSNLIFDMLTVY